jgi:hypothetical protein
MDYFLTLSSLFIYPIVLIIKMQIPKEVPHPDRNSPLDLNNPADIIIYIVIPLLIVLLYIFGRRRKKKDF